MNKILQIPTKCIIALSVAILISTTSFAATFTAITSGNWSSAATWGGTAPSYTNTTDQIIIPSGMTVTMDDHVTLNGTTASLAVNGTLTSTSTRMLTVTKGTITGSGSIDIGVLDLATDAAFTYAGTLTVYTLNTAMATFTTAADVTVKETLNLKAGILTLNSGGKLTMATGSMIVLAGGTLANNGGTLGFGNNYSVVYTGGNATSGLELSGSGLRNVNFNAGSGKSVMLSTDLTTYGTLTLGSGNLSLNGRNLTIEGDVSATGDGTISTTGASNITINTAGGTTGTLNFNNSNNTVNNFTVNVGNNNSVKIGNTLNINGDLNLNSGTLTLNSSNLNINGNVTTGGTGNISSNATSNISINSSSSNTGSLSFAGTNNTVNNLTINLGNSGTANLASNLNVMGTLNMMAGKLNIGSNNLHVGSGATVANSSSASYVVTSPAGYVSIAMLPGTTAIFPVGTSTLYFPATIQLNSNATARTMSVGVSPAVYSNGTVGADLSTTRPLVKNTWNINSDISSNLNMNLQLAWQAAAEVNGFMRNSSYISHYTNGSWDMKTASPAVSAGAGMYSQTSTNVTSVSPFTVMDVNTASLKEVTSNYAFGISPNPTADVITIRNNSNSNEIINVDVINALGKVVKTFTQTGTNTVLSLKDLNAGYYFVRVSTDKVWVSKVIVKL